MSKIPENIVPGNSLPLRLLEHKIQLINFKIAKKIGECKKKKLVENCSSPYVVYTYLGLYYEIFTGKYYDLCEERWVKPEKASDKEFAKKTRLNNIWHINSFNRNECHPEESHDIRMMHYYLTKIYDEHVEMVKEKIAKIKIRDENIAKKENRRKSKIIDGFHDENYNENWKGIML